MRKLYPTILVALFFLCSCFPYNADGPTLEAEHQFHDFSERTDGHIIYSQEERFIITVFPTRIAAEDGERYLIFEFSVENNKEIEYKDFQITLEIDQGLDQILAAGAFSMPFPEFLMAYRGSPAQKKGAGVGMGLAVKRLIRPDLKLDEVFDHGKEYTLHLSWKGGKESIAVAAPISDEIAGP